MDQQSHTRSQSLNESQRQQRQQRQGNRSYTPPRSDVTRETLSSRDSEEMYDDEQYDDVWPSRMPSSARRYRSDVRTEGGYTPTTRATRTSEMQAIPRTSSPGRVSNPTRNTSSIPARRTATQTNLPALQSSQSSPPRRRTVNIEAVQPAKKTLPLKSGHRVHWLVYAGLAMLGMLIVWLVLTSFLSWWQVKMDDLHYGRPRTSQYDVVISPGDTPANRSHFIVMNLKRHIEIIDCPASDCTKAKVLIGPVLIGQNQDLAPATLSFKDVNGDGKLDIIVNVQDSHFIFINDNGSFRQARQSDNVHL